jgi:two-component system, OmpR family, response regulator
MPLNHILYIEDNTDIQAIAQIALEVVGGFTLHTCSSGNQALDAVASGFTPDLILLDVMMPEMDGPTTYRHLRKNRQTMTTPVIFMTAKVQESEIAYYKELGAIGVIAKPFDPMQLAVQVRQLFMLSEAQNDRQK